MGIMIRATKTILQHTLQLQVKQKTNGNSSTNYNECKNNSAKRCKADSLVFPFPQTLLVHAYFMLGRLLCSKPLLIDSVSFFVYVICPPLSPNTKSKINLALSGSSRYAKKYFSIFFLQKLCKKVFPKEIARHFYRFYLHSSPPKREEKFNHAIFKNCEMY